MTPVRRNRGLVVLALISMGGLAGCQSSSMDEFAPQAGVRNTGTYPDLNERRTAETAQLTGAEADQKIAELKAAQSGAVAQGGGNQKSNPAEFRQARENQRKTLKEIEGD